MSVKIKSAFILVAFSFFSFLSFANEETQEKAQIQKINEQYVNEFNKSKVILDERTQEILSSSREGLGEFKNMIFSWTDFIEKKCAFVTVESKGTEAETALFLSCKIEEYNKVNEYLLNSIISVP
jgi:hypothetical protein